MTNSPIGEVLQVHKHSKDPIRLDAYPSTGVIKRFDQVCKCTSKM